MVVLLGKKNAVTVYVVLMALAYLTLIIGALLRIMPYYSLVAVFTLPLAFMAVRTLRKNYDKINELLPANKATIGLHLLFGILVTVGYVIDAMLR